MSINLKNLAVDVAFTGFIFISQLVTQDDRNLASHSFAVCHLC